MALFTIAGIAAADVYVDDSNSGDPSMDGTEDHPWDKIRKGVDDAQEGETVYVWAGTYRENLEIDMPVTLQGNGTSATYLNGMGGVAINISYRHVVIKGIAFHNCSNAIETSAPGFDIDSNLFEEIDEDCIAIWINGTGSSLNMTNQFLAFPSNVTWNDMDCEKSGISVNFTHIGSYLTDSASVDIGAFNFNNNTIVAKRGVNINKVRYLGHSNTGSTSFTWGGFRIVDNDINATIGGVSTHWQMQARFWGETLNGSARVILGSLDMSNNVIEAGHEGIHFPMIRDVGNNLYGTSNVTMGDVRFDDNDILVWNKTDGEAGIELRDIAYFGEYMYDSASVRMGDISFSGNTINSTGDGIYQDDFDYWGTRMWDNTTCLVGNTTFNWNNITAGEEGIYFGEYEYHGYNLYDDAYVRVGNAEFNHNNITSGSNGMDVDDWDSWGQYCYNRSVVKHGYMQVNYNTIVAGIDGIETNSHGRNANDLRGSASVTIGSTSIDGNVIDAGFAGIDADRWEYRGCYLYNDTVAVLGDLSISDNVITAVFDGIEHEEWANYGRNLYGRANVTVGDIRLDNNTVTAGGHGIELDDFDNYGYYMYNDSSFRMGDLTTSNNTVVANMTGIEHPECEYHGYHIYHNSKVTMGSIHLDWNNVTANGTGFFMDDFGYYGYNVHDASSFTMGDFTFNDNTIVAGEEGVYQSDFSYIGQHVRGDSHVTIGNHEYNRNNITSRYNGLIIEDHYHWGRNMNGTSTFTRVDLSIVDNRIRTSNGSASHRSSGLEFRWLNSWGRGLSDDAEVTHGSVYVVGNDIEAEDAAINFTEQSNFDYFGSQMSGNAITTIGHVYIQNNTLTGNYTIHVDDPDVIGVENVNNSVFNFGGIVISGNTISSRQRGISIYDLPKIWSNRTGSQNLSFFRVLDNRINSGRVGIWLQDAFQTEIAFNNCTVDKYGIFLDSSNLNDVHDNEIDGSDYGMWLWSADRSVIWNNSIRYCGVGVWDRSNDYMDFHGNEIDNSTMFGIRGRDPEWCNYWDNVITGSGDDAFAMNNSNNCTIYNNTIWRNDMDGIYLWSGCENVTIFNNSIKWNGERGIYIRDTNHSMIENNTIGFNDVGIRCNEGTNFLNFTYNEIFWNDGYGIYLESNNCTVHHNNFDNNTASPQCSDEGIGNMWDDGVSEGNWWNDWNGTGNYTIGGSPGNVDRYPLGNKTTTNAPEKVPEFGLLLMVTALVFIAIVIRRRRK